MALGYLTVQTRTAHDAIPVKGVAIRILDECGCRVYELTSDENGETEKISLETVEKSRSLDPDYSGTPYARYDLAAEAEGYRPIHISGIPIFEGESAVQMLAFEPLQQTARERGNTPANEIAIGSFAIDMPEWRSQEGSASRPYVLRQVVIPNPITVHLGSPSSYAPNVQVSFSDYVKNVACSEIYPTWPDAALRANIYAIITFALNRVFTEWYRSRGYSFDITGSTAYDQYFVYGRTIYESVSRIVDEIFNEYVRREGQNAPYFTSFCNGTSAVCAGLSQWGTVSLAERGYTPLRILRTYYPNDVEIAETNIITDVIDSYPGTALRTGSRGLNVQTIQTYLGRIRRNYPAIPAITDETGVFGESTRTAVVKFQSVFNLQADGIVGKATWYKISSLYTAVARLAELDSEGTSLGVGTVPPSSVLRQGSRGTDVITLQYILDTIADFYSYVPAVSQDGVFGGKTRQAVAAFQQMRNLTPDGIVGKATWNALYETYLGIMENVPSVRPEAGIIEYVVRPGDTLWLLAVRFGTTVNEIRKLNDLTGDLLTVGQVLKIPVK